MLKYEILATDGNARNGVLHTAHGVVQTPVFMPVGTQATVKGMTPLMLEQTGADIILGNTYHLMLRPGAERINKLGGLHDFMQWHKPILTDSGGFQVMSLSSLCETSEEGVVFRSHIDGSKHKLTPEIAIEIQRLLDSNIAMVLDECPPYPINKEQAAASMQLSMRWARRCKQTFKSCEGYGLFGIVQGSVFEDLRCESAHELRDIGFDGYAVGGLAVGEGQEIMYEVLDYTVSHLPNDKPRYLMGVGKPDDIIGAVLRGIDMFDCVLPTRSGRNARAYTHYGEMNIRNSHFADDSQPVDLLCDCYCCQNFTRAYIHHLFKAKEMLAAILLTTHNLRFYQILMSKLREAISQQKLKLFAEDFLQQLAMGDKSR